MPDQNDVLMRIVAPEGIRRLPIYLLLDCSGSMDGAPIEAVHRGVELFAQEVGGDPYCQQTVHVGLITFDNDARMVTSGLVPITEFQPPPLSASGRTSLGRALQVLQESIDRDVKPVVKDKEKGDFKPIVFILTDGEPTDDWQGARQAIADREHRKVVNVITVGCGPHINEDKLKEIAIGPTFRMDNSETSFRTFFKWVSQSAITAVKTLSDPAKANQAVQLPPTGPGIQYIP